MRKMRKDISRIGSVIERKIATIYESFNHGLEVVEVSGLSRQEAVSLQEYLRNDGYATKLKAVLNSRPRKKETYVVHVLRNREKRAD